jgi:hypothetical protein
MSLMLLGGYSPGYGGGGREVSLEPGDWMDADTWRQDFEVFECDPAAFSAVLHGAMRWHVQAPIAGLWVLADEGPPET